MQLTQHDTRVTDRSSDEASGRRRLPVLPAVTVAVVLLALGLAIGRFTAPESEDPKAVASSEIMTMLSDRVIAVNSLGRDAIASFYTEDAVLTEMDQVPPVITTGNGALLQGKRTRWQQSPFLLTANKPVQEEDNEKIE